MKTIRKINDDLAIAGQLTSDQLPQITQQGFKSVVNLRSPDEEGFLSNEQQEIEALGLYYINVPIKVEGINDEVAAQVLQKIDELSKPALVHCNNSMRSAAIALMHIATHQGVSLGQAFTQAEQLGLFGTNTPKKL
ncbi:hypothetical protein H6F77_07765 [Microcoleus sp. FACHB-831]|uniref:beta-lactamase hydrolase domain-containing protein n=1 Tax=Microcoleus sp. FACHB-831 TaxID=2692827 RepID=UPI001686EFFF|nr:sulfur transferase domain-containing protein [Microcoleus sp. FACHB-831]MBD1920983.1 hypothetical protein [Microcoleus sp. FACHB-831]